MNLMLTLDPGSALLLPRLRGLQLTLHSGRLWLTRCGDPDDHIVNAGSTLAVDGRSRVVVECDSAEAARLQVKGPARRVHVITNSLIGPTAAGGYRRRTLPGQAP